MHMKWTHLDVGWQMQAGCTSNDCREKQDREHGCRCCHSLATTQLRAAPRRPRTRCQVARGLGLDPGAAPKPKAARRLPTDPDKPKPAKPPRPPKAEASAAAAGALQGPGPCATSVHLQMGCAVLLAGCFACFACPEAPAQGALRPAAALTRPFVCLALQPARRLRSGRRGRLRHRASRSSARADGTRGRPRRSGRTTR